ncbi:MAG: VOC family protein [Pirellulaceae bacterium]
MPRHLAGIAEIVESIDEALKLYHDTLGLEIHQRMEDDYVMLKVPGVLHFGIWSRAAAAEAILGSRDLADQVPLGFTIEFEVDDVDATAGQLTAAGCQLVHAPRTEPWGQKSCRILAVSTAPLGFAETPWARQLKTDVIPEKPDDD